ncbi:MAG: 23S rRNA (guanosine(2251)-2'-O)-methyltransferase RlmB [Alphaproteobacteria bacterium]
MPKQTIAPLPIRGEPFTSDDAIWLYGLHPVRAALANEVRRIRRLIVRPPLDDGVAALAKRRQVVPETVDRLTLESMLPPAAVHQGIALLVDPLPPADIEPLCESPAADSVVVVLDQVTDPHNVGAILRSAAAFGAAAIIVQSRHAPPAHGALAKSASGALELLPLVAVTNLARALAQLADAGYRVFGLDSTAETRLDQADLSGPVALVLGSEGKGMRRLTQERCDLLVRLPTGKRLADLNVSNAAAICLYELARRRE